MDFDFNSGAVELFEYSGGMVAFEEGYLEAVREFHKIQKHTRGFGLLNLSQKDYAQVLMAESELDPCLTREIHRGPCINKIRSKSGWVAKPPQRL